MQLIWVLHKVTFHLSVYDCNIFSHICIQMYKEAWLPAESLVCGVCVLLFFHFVLCCF